jgi:hypothetical protein
MRKEYAIGFMDLYLMAKGYHLSIVRLELNWLIGSIYIMGRFIARGNKLERGLGKRHL